jgi:pyridinium-3,5-bisthiocarboxylic acid mononucleotide nickel chelatase
MTKQLYFDCFSGISGDMCLGALIAAGADIDQLKSALSSLKLAGFELQVKQVAVNGIGATDVTVQVTEETQPHRHLHHIQQIIDASELSPWVKDSSKRVFYSLAVAEAKVHQSTLEKVHFHEVGALDAIVDIVGSVIALELLGINEIFFGPLPTGKGFVTCQHGEIPLPAPAVVELLSGFTIYDSGVVGELVTPTGAALVTTLGKQCSGIPKMNLVGAGYGAGKKSFAKPNLLRVLIGEVYP